MKLTPLSCILFSTVLSVSSGWTWAGNNPQQVLAELQKEWAITNYQYQGDEQEDRFTALIAKAETATDNFPGNADVFIWQGIIQSTTAGAVGGLGALSLVKASRKSLERALDLDPQALNGSAYTSLGALYYQVPSWPLAFGSAKKARNYLEKALEINPEGIDSNYFYADFLFEEGDYKQAQAAIEKAIAAAPRPDRPIADEGRRKEIEDLRSRILANVSNSVSP